MLLELDGTEENTPRWARAGPLCQTVPSTIRVGEPSRLGHVSTLITMDMYQHVSAATDGAAAELVAGLIFGVRDQSVISGGS